MCTQPMGGGAWAFGGFAKKNKRIEIYYVGIVVLWQRVGRGGNQVGHNLDQPRHCSGGVKGEHLASWDTGFNDDCFIPQHCLMVVELIVIEGVQFMTAG